MILQAALVALFISDFQLLQQRYSVTPVVPVSNEQTVGALTVTAGDGSIVSTIPRGAQRVQMLSLAFAASCAADVHVQSIALRRSGPGDQQDIDVVYAESGLQRISNVASISSRDGRIELRLRRFTVPACEERTVQILADFSGEADIAGEHRIVLDAGEPVDAAGARVTVRQAVGSQLRRTAGYAQGRIEVEVLPLLRRVRFGADRVVARARLTARDEDHALMGIRFTNSGSAHDRDLTNLFLATNGGQRISAVTPSMVGDSVHLSLSPSFALGENEQYLLELHADVNVGSSATVGFTVEEPSDVVSTILRGRSRLR